MQVGHRLAQGVGCSASGPKSPGDHLADSDKLFAGSIPKYHDSLMVPLIFEAHATNLAELVAASASAPASAPGSELETAADSGVVTRALAPRLGADAR